MKQELEQAITAAIRELFPGVAGLDFGVELTRPDEQFGDYATNIMLQLAKWLDPAPRDRAKQVARALKGKLEGMVVKVEVAGPGFLNITLSDTALARLADAEPVQLNDGKRVLLEYSCPNTFKELHTGHLYQTIVGDVLGKLLALTGATVYRANFGGDVGLHVAKCLYGIVQTFGGELPEKLDDITGLYRIGWLSQAYVRGATAYEEDSEARTVITGYNSEVYRMHREQDRESPLARIYWQCREWSYDYFKDFYKRIRVDPFEAYYPESATLERGLQTVRDHQGAIFSESDGAVVYPGEQDGLHTRVYITSQGLPTYEAKDTGVILNEYDDFPYDRRILMTGNDQAVYMQVVFAALARIDPALAAKQTHLTNGTVRFGSGVKMSSRLGNVTRAVEVIEEINEITSDEHPGTDYYATTLAAIKYSFLKHRLGGDIAFDIKESVGLEGNSGPYLQYAHARARSILAKAGDDANSGSSAEEALQPDERSLLRKLGEYAETIERATTELMPHHICTYLYELAQAFNRFYEKNRVIGDDRQALRLELVTRYADTLHGGLGLLGISAPDRM